jgi:hypothetical protein
MPGSQRGKEPPGDELPISKLGYKSTTLYQHQNTLRLMMQGLGLTNYPGKAASAADMAEFFK